MLQDEQIVDLYFDRDERALVETSDKYGKYCRTIARNIVHDEETAKECFNDTLYTSWNVMPPKRPSCLKAFVGKITRNLSLKRMERASAIKRGGGEVALTIEELGECMPDPSMRNADQIAEDMVIHDVLDKFLADLPAQTRRIFVRRYWYCSSVKEISVALKLSESNVKTTLSRGRSKLKTALEEAGVVL